MNRSVFSRKNENLCHTTVAVLYRESFLLVAYFISIEFEHHNIFEHCVEGVLPVRDLTKGMNALSNMDGELTTMKAKVSGSRSLKANLLSCKAWLYQATLKGAVSRPRGRQ